MFLRVLREKCSLPTRKMNMQGDILLNFPLDKSRYAFSNLSLSYEINKLSE